LQNEHLHDHISEETHMNRNTDIVWLLNFIPWNQLTKKVITDDNTDMPKFLITTLVKWGLPSNIQVFKSKTANLQILFSLKAFLFNNSA